MPKASGKFWISFFVWIFLIGFLSLTPKTGIPLEKGRDKALHFIFYLPFGIFGYYHPRRGFRSVLLASLFGVNLGLLMELAQRRIPGRVCDGWDLLADALGVLAGLIFFGIRVGLRKRRAEWEERKRLAGAPAKS